MFSLKKISDLTDKISLDDVTTLGQKVKKMGQKNMGPNQAVKSASWLLAGAALGSILTFYFDPREGQRRRTQVKDKAVSMGRNVQDVTRRRIQELNDRVRDVASQAEGALKEGMEKRA